MKLPLADIGPESEKGVVAALDDLFGPSFREIGEYLADKVRLHRLRSLKKILERAKEFGPAGSEFLAPPSLKFLLNFTEKASLEENDELCDLWARLLVHASETDSSRNVFFADIISKLGVAEAALFEQLISAPRVRRGAISQIEDAGDEFSHRQAERRYQDASVASLDDEFGILFGTIARLECFGGRIVEALIWGDDDQSCYEAVPWPEASADRISLELLQQLGLIRWVSSVDYGATRGDMTISFAYVTPLGAEFYYSTHDPKLRLTPDERPMGQYPDSDRIPINAPIANYIETLDPDVVLGG
jgi:hypothetical protein